MNKETRQFIFGFFLLIFFSACAGIRIEMGLFKFIHYAQVAIDTCCAALGIYYVTKTI